MRIRSLPRVVALATALVFLLPAGGRSWSRWQFHTIYRFAGGSDGAQPLSLLIGDASGALYGTTGAGGGCPSDPSHGCGTVFELTPPAPNGRRSEIVLHAFANGADGASPIGALVADASGSLYGVTFRGGPAGAGTIYELERTAGGAYVERVLYAFGGGADGLYPDGGLVLDAAGDLFGEAQQGGLGFGTVFELAAPSRQAPGNRTLASAGTRRFETLYAFTGKNGDGVGPNGGLIASGGSLYGVTNAGGRSVNSYGTVFELSPPARGVATWTERIIYAFRSSAEGRRPLGPLLPGSHGTFYGTTFEGGTNCGNGYGGPGCGTIFEVSPPPHGAGRWTERVLFSFGQWFGGTKFGPGYLNGGLVADGRGRLYGTASSGGTGAYGGAFRITPPATGYAYTETDLVDFADGNSGGGPSAGLYRNGGSALFGTTSQAGMRGGAGFGTVYELKFE